MRVDETLKPTGFSRGLVHYNWVIKGGADHRDCLPHLGARGIQERL